MALRYRYRLYPNRPQREALARAPDCARVVYNDCVAARREAHRAGTKHPSSTVLQRRLITEVKHTPERAWLAGVSNIVLQQAVRDCDAAYARSFDAVKREGGRFVGPPRFKSRKDRRQAIRLHRGGFSVRDDGRMRIADARADFLHQQTTHVVRENQAIYIEDLAVQGLSWGRLAKSVHDAAWGQFRRLLEEKARRYGRTVVAVGRHEPTSRMCSHCGHVDGPKPLSVRPWTCPACATVHDRDTNAASNILALGRRERLNACGADVGPPLAGAVGGEAGTHRPVSA